LVSIKIIEFKEKFATFNLMDIAVIV